MGKAQLSVFGFFAAIILGVYFWASPGASWSGVIWMMMGISLGCLFVALASEGVGFGKVFLYAIFFMFFIGSIFSLMRAKEDREQEELVAKIITPYSDIASTNTIPSHKTGVLKKWQIKSDNGVRLIKAFYSNDANLGDWELEKTWDTGLILARDEERLKIEFESGDWSYATFTHYISPD